MAGRSKGQLYENFLAFHQRDLASGNLSPCSGPEQVRQGKGWLQSAAGQRFQRLDFYRLAQDLVAPRCPRPDPFRALGKAFELLELISVNLYLWPWRKEIQSIKMLPDPLSGLQKFAVPNSDLQHPQCSFLYPAIYPFNVLCFDCPPHALSVGGD
uniref:spermatogenesis-associated protein 2 isoform X2 n=1 Tax=Pristiophorus japonicus TaxID=55135 RepID=UPI00398ECBD8